MRTETALGQESGRDRIIQWVSLSAFRVWIKVGSVEKLMSQCSSAGSGELCSNGSDSEMDLVMGFGLPLQTEFIVPARSVPNGKRDLIFSA